MTSCILVLVASCTYKGEGYFRAPTARRSVAPRTVELLWALNGRPGGSVGEKEVLTVRHGQRLTFLWGFGLSNQLEAAREIFLVSAPNTHGSKIAPFGSDFGMLGKLPKEAANLVSTDISECRRKNWRFPPESGFGGCHPRILVSSHPAPLCYTPMHTICPDHRIYGVLSSVDQNDTVIASSGTVSSNLTPLSPRFRSFIAEPHEEKGRGVAPLPELAWANRQEMWDLMVKKETGMYRRLAPDVLLSRHTALQPRMRAILLDWLIEVCEVYRLHRETFYLAVDFIDRFLSVSPSVPKNRLQLIGVSCLFIGAKIEEIYPPKLQEFAYVTGKFC